MTFPRGDHGQPYQGQPYQQQPYQGQQNQGGPYQHYPHRAPTHARQPKRPSPWLIALLAFGGFCALSVTWYGVATAFHLETPTASQASARTITVTAPPAMTARASADSTPRATAPASHVPASHAPASAAVAAGPNACTQQVKRWLASSDGSGIQGNTDQHDISAIMFDATAYQKYGLQSFLDGMNTEVTYLTYIQSPFTGAASPDIPSCADPQGIWGFMVTSGSFLGDAGNAGQDSAGSSQATSDVDATLSDFAKLKAELATTAPGSGLEGLTANP